MIEARGVSKHYGDLAALSDVSFDIASGEIVGLLGPNGAGKTTLMRLLTGYYEPTAGSIRIDGLDVEVDSIAVQQRIGYLPEQTPLYPEMLVQEYLDMVADFRNLSSNRRTPLLSEAIWATGLEEHLTRPIGALSKGFRQRVGLAQAILHQPKLLILDEPTASLDPTQVVQVRELIKRLAQNATVLFSSHVLTEVEQVCERAIILLGGRVRADARLSELRSAQGAVVSVAADSVGMDEAPLSRSEAVETALRALDGVVSVNATGMHAGCLRYEVRARDDSDLCRKAFCLVRDRGWELAELRPVERDLESVFRDLVAEYESGDGGLQDAPPSATSGTDRESGTQGVG